MRWVLTRGRGPYLVALALVTVLLGWCAAAVDVERSNESMKSSDEVLATNLAEFNREFGSDEGLIVALTHPRLLSAEGLGLLSRISKALARIDGVRRVVDLTTVSQVVSGRAGAETAPLIETPIEKSSGASLKAALERNPEYTNLLVSADRSTAGIFVEVVDRPDDDEYRAAMIASVRRLARTVVAPGVLRLSGLTAHKHEVAVRVQTDQLVLVPLVVVVLGVVLWAFGRRAAAVVLPLAVTGVSSAWTLGAYSLAGLSLNTITSLLPPVVMVLSVATSVHVYYAWLEHDECNDTVERIISSLGPLAVPCLATALTTAFGLGALALSDTPAVRQFGLFAAFGVMISFAVGITLVPVGLSFLSPPLGAVRGKRGRLDAVLAGSARLSIDRPVAVLLTAAALTAAGGVGMTAIRSNTDLTRFLKRDNLLRRDTLFVDEHLTGVNSLEFLVTRRDTGPLTRVEDLRLIQSLARRLAANQEVVAVLSVADVIAALHRGETGGDVARLPGDRADLLYCFDLLETAGSDVAPTLMSRDFRVARVSARVHAIGSRAAAVLIDRALGTGANMFGPDYDIVATGAFHQVVVDSNRIVASQVRTFGLALLLVVAAMAVLLRRPLLVAVSLVPNVIPVIVSAGAMGWLGIDLSTGTAMVAAVVIGMAVDDTIHYLVRFRREYDGDTAAAVRRVTTRTGTALAVTSAVLVLGLWVGAFGSFKPTIYFSMLSGTTMMLALACDLLVLPACLVLMGRSRGE